MEVLVLSAGSCVFHGLWGDGYENVWRAGRTMGCDGAHSLFWCGVRAEKPLDILYQICQFRVKCSGETGVMIERHQVGGNDTGTIRLTKISRFSILPYHFGGKCKHVLESVKCR